jgi:hypothetical protein
MVGSLVVIGCAALPRGRPRFLPDTRCVRALSRPVARSIALARLGLILPLPCLWRRGWKTIPQFMHLPIWSAA